MSLNIVGIKAAFKTVLDAANTTTASVDLSLSLSCGRINTIATKSPNSDMFGSDVLPAIAIFTDRKEVTMQDIVRDPRLAKRKATVDFSVAGIIWNSDYSTIEGNSADDDIEKLMENIEDVLRDNPTLNGTVLSQHPTDVTYHNLSLSEEQHYKVGIATFQCVKYY